MKSYNVAVIGGDGTGPEVVREAIKVLDAASKKFEFKLNYTDYDFGGDRYLRTKEVLPESAADELRKFPVILLGAIGHPDVKPGILEKGILLRLRFEMEQYINLRPVKLYDERFCPLKDKGPNEIDFVVIRENNEGLYIGSGGFVFKRHATRDCRAGKRQHAARSGTLFAICLRTRPKTARGQAVERPQTRGHESRQESPAHPLRQDQRADVRVRSLGARVP